MKNLKYLIIILLISFVIIIGISYSTKNKINSYDNDNINFSYDSTWQLKKATNEVKLIHQKSQSTINIQEKNLEKNYMDTKLSEIVEDLINSIENQNPEYKLINKEILNNLPFEAYSYLYENDKEQVLVYIFKKNEKLVFISYIAENKYFDIILDSVDNIIASFKIKTGIEIFD